MPRVPVPPEVDTFLAKANPAVIATIRPDGSPHTAATWYDWEDGRVLVNMRDTRKRLEYMRNNPHVALTVLGVGSWYDHVSLVGRVVSIEEDSDLSGIDRLALRYTQKPFGSRDERRISAWIEPDSWHAWPLPR